MNRRNFLHTGAALAAGVAVPSVTAAAVEPESKRLTKADLPTPALLVDLDAFEATIQPAAKF